MSIWNFGSGGKGKTIPDDWYTRLAKTTAYLLASSQKMKDYKQPDCIMEPETYDVHTGLESFLKALDKKKGFCDEHKRPQLAVPRPASEDKYS